MRTLVTGKKPNRRKDNLMKILLLTVPENKHMLKSSIKLSKMLKRKNHEVQHIVNGFKVPKKILKKKERYFTHRLTIRFLKTLSQSGFDFIHINSHTSTEGVCTSPMSVSNGVDWGRVYTAIHNNKNLVIDGCDAGRKDSDARILAKVFERVFALNRKLSSSDTHDIWTQFYRLINKAETLDTNTIRKIVRKINQTYGARVLYYFRKNRLGKILRYSGRIKNAT